MKQKSKTAFALSIIFVFALFLVANLSFAAEWGGWEITYPWNPPEPNLPEYVKYIYQFSFWVGAFLAVIVIIIGGIEWSSAAANPQLKAAAKNKITRSIIGLLALLSIYIILNTINPDLVKLKEVQIKDYTTGDGSGVNNESSVYQELLSGKFEYKINGSNIAGNIANGGIKGLPTNASGEYAGLKETYFSKENTLPNESSEPCECFGGWTGGEKCGTYCFHACRRLIPDNNRIYGTISNIGPSNTSLCPDYGAKGDVIKCSCYESFEDNFSQVETFPLPDGTCECQVDIGDTPPSCWSENHEFCVDYCKRVKGFKFGYTSGCAEGKGRDAIYCTCIK